MEKTMYRILLLAVFGSLLLINVSFASETDDRIIASAKESYVFKTFLKNGDVKIQSKDGVVTLSGTVAEESHKLLAQETAANLPGVKSVNNELEFKGERPAEMSDAWITLKVKSTLLFHRSVSAMTEVSTEDGIVILKGEADNQAQIDLTTAYARDVEGVKEVINEMTVAKTPAKPAEKKPEEKTVGDKIDDASITALVKAALLSHRSTSALNTKVETSDGVVTLSGVAKNAAEKELAAKYASDVKGVKNVVNNMTVE
ncbi:BON domain-containing protein [Desulfonatronum sp. SC1]|uniref:BON domain-containing protein n=1 Tax=Desulfonatronum sp. SC1 TaxID=2109626 RepID=UPI000D324E5F|nr:BON domain-containing protein [Desulfonatronum sp. SC1]PTN36325.1 transport-associated protein [Desulfonatronum sp. SC1]